MSGTIRHGLEAYPEFGYQVSAGVNSPSRLPADTGNETPSSTVIGSSDVSGVPVMNPLRLPATHSGSGTLWAMLLFACLLFCGQTMAATPPGTIIRSQAEASFVDEFNKPYLVTSNEVTTLIQEVTGVRLESPQHLWGHLGDDLVFSHLLTNTGNITANYQLTATGDVASTLYLDMDNDGQPKERYQITGPITLTPGQNISLLVKATVPDRDYTNITLTAQVVLPQCPTVDEDQSQGRCRAVINNTISRSAGVVYKVMHKADKTKAFINDKVETTLTFYRSDQTSYNSFVDIEYLLPAELEYIEGSAWLHQYEGDGVTPKPVEPEISAEALRFHFEKDTDQVGSPSNRHDGRLVFKTRVKGGAGKTLYNAAKYTFCEPVTDKPGGCPEVNQKTNYLPLAIKGMGVSLNGTPFSPEPHIADPLMVTSAPAGSVVAFTNYLWNRGTEQGAFEVKPVTGENTFPEGSLFCLTTETQCPDDRFTAYDNTAPLTINDLYPGNYQVVRLLVKLPATVTVVAQQHYRLTLQAEVPGSDHLFDTMENLLLHIEAAANYAMDLTIEKPHNQGGAGDGDGPEADAQKALSGLPGTTVVFDSIFINNTGDQVDSYLLELQPAPGKALPESFKWQFLNNQGQPIASSGAVAGKSHAEVKLQIDLPAGQTPDEWMFYVHAHSASGTASDSLTLAVAVLGDEQLVLEPNGSGQVTPGSFITFAHTLSNSGNRDISGLELTVSDSRASQGWQSMVYHDFNGDGELSGDETIIDEPFDLAIGGIRRLIVKVFAPANAPQGEINITTLTAAWGENHTLAITDSARVNSTNVVITKKQVHWDCKNSELPAFSTETFPVSPGECVVYRLTASNHGSESARNVMIHDRAPAFTRFVPSDNVLKLPYTETGSAVDYDRHTISGSTISANWPKGLAPGASVSLIFGIRIQ